MTYFINYLISLSSENQEEAQKAPQTDNLCSKTVLLAPEPSFLTHSNILAMDTPNSSLTLYLYLTVRGFSQKLIEIKLLNLHKSSYLELIFFTHSLLVVTFPLNILCKASLSKSHLVEFPINSFVLYSYKKMYPNKVW